MSQMASNPIDEYEARNSLRRSRGRWRLAALVLLFAAVVFASFKLNQESATDHIARFSVDDVIQDDLDRDALLKEIAEDEAVKALILKINSPGGTVTGSEALYESIREVAEKKPVVATIGQVAASGGYIAALGSEQIFARQTSITGSVGVIFMAPNAHKLLDKIGIEVFEIKSGDMKAEPVPYKPINPKVAEISRIVLEDNFNWFLDLVKERRGLGDNAMTTISDGRVFSGRMAEEIGLIDAIGDEDDALAWLEEEKSVSAELDVWDYSLSEGKNLLERVFNVLGFAPNGLTTLEKSALSPTVWAIYR